MTTVLKDANGIEMVPVVVGQSLPFAKACLAEWRARDGVDRSWMLRNKAFNVPADLIDRARARLGRSDDE